MLPFNLHHQAVLLITASGILALWAMALFFSVPVVHAAGIVSVCDQSHLVAALSGGGTVTFSCSGTITLTSTLTIASNTTLDGAEQSVTISGGGTVRVFSVNSGVFFAMQNLTVTMGNCGASCNGGGIYNSGSVNATNVTFSGNVASNNGGGMFDENGSNATLTNVTFISNTASAGGGLYNDHSSPTISNTTFLSNTANNGGAIENFVSHLSLNHVTFNNNTATNGKGGGMHNLSEVVCTPWALGSDCVMYIDNPSLTNVTFISNSANYGGGIDNDISSPTITNTTFLSNTATNGNGGGSMHNKSQYTCMHWFLGACTSSAWQLSTPTVRNSILWGASGGEIYNEISGGTPPRKIEISNSVVQGGCPTDSNCTTAIITTTPMLGGLGIYGGNGQQTIPLLPGSPAIDATSANCPATDQRGFARSLPTCDIGAFESLGFTLTKTGGDNQSTFINTAFTNSLSVNVTSTNNEPVNGGVVTFVGPITLTSASTIPFTYTATITNGIVSQNVWANGKTGSYNVTVSANGANTITFGLTNNARPPIDAGGFHTCGLKANGTLQCWGYNEFGQTTVPSPNANWAQVSAGYTHTCGLKTDGTLQCWGNSDSGQTTVPSPNANWVQVSAGSFHTCGLKVDGTLQCWGDNYLGQTTVPSPNANWVQVSTGDFYACGLKADGTLQCWGAYSYGQSTVPSPNANWVQVSAGKFHSCGQKADSTLQCWGDNFTGRTAVPNPNANWVQVSTGNYHTCGLKANGSLQCWGAIGSGYDYGQSIVPSPNVNWVQVSTGDFHTCGLKADGTIRCWGWNIYGQAPLITLTPSTLPDATFGIAYTQNIAATGTTGATPPYLISVISGTVPTGLALNANGTWSGTPNALGTFTFTAQATDANNIAGTQDYALTVVNANTTTTLTVSPSPINLWQSATFTATVIAGAGSAPIRRAPSAVCQATGNVVFKDRMATLGTIALNSNCKAIFTTTQLTPGSHPMTANYSGDANYNGSTSNPVTMVVNGFTIYLPLIRR